MKKQITLMLLFIAFIALSDFKSFAGCPVMVLPPANGANSGNARAPIGTFKFMRTVYLITPDEMAASGIVNGSVFSQIGWTYYLAQSVAVTGNLNVYFQNTSDAGFAKTTTWATNIATMTLAHSGSVTLPGTPTQIFDIPLVGAAPFTYTGGGLYVAFEFSNPSNPLSTGGSIACSNITIGGTNGLVGNQSNTSLPTALAASAFRPITRLAITTGSSLCYCTPISTNGGALGDAITAFNFATLTYTTTSALLTPGHLELPTPRITAGQGVTYPVALSNQYSGDANNIWIDFDDNGILDDLNEAVFQGGPGTAVTGTLTIPALAPLGLHRLRLRNYDTGSNGLGTVSPCSGVVYGETKDFLVNIVPATYVDVQVTNVYTLGKVAIEYGSPLTIKARVVNGSATAITSYNVHLAVTGNNSFTNDQTVTLSPGQNTIVTFAPYTPTVLSAADVVTVSVAPDDDNSNNSQSWNQAVTQNLYSYKNPAQVNAGGVGFTGGTGDFVAKFNSHIGTNFPYNVYSPQINQIQVDFFTPNGQTYQLGIWDATGPGGTPGTSLWTSPNQTQVAGTSFISVPNIVVAGDYFIGVRQIGTTNIGFAFQFEGPIRTGAFYYTSPTGTSTWTDFATTNSNFRFSIVAQVRIPQAPNCPVQLLPATGSALCPLNPASLSWASGGGATADNYNVYLSTNQADVIAHAPAALVSAAQVGTTYTSGALIPSSTYYWTIVANSIAEGLSSAGCSVQSFTVGATYLDCYCTPVTTVGCGNGDITNVTFNAINNTSTCNPPGYTLYPTGVGTTTTVNNGVAYNLSVTTSDNCITSVWVDWNHNGVFETTEWNQIALTSAAGVPDTISLLVPVNALSGQTRVRIRSRFAGFANADVDACTDFGSGETEDYTITVSICSGTPDPGNTVSSLPSVCHETPFVLSLQNSQPPLGISYQWQSAPSSTGTWINVGTNNNSLTAVQASPTWYKCIVTCSASGLTGTSTAVLVGMNNSPGPKIAEADTAVCGNSPGYYIHVNDTGAYSGGYPIGTYFEWVNYTPATLGLDSLFVNSTDNYKVVVTLPGEVGACSDTSNVIHADFTGSQAPVPLLSSDPTLCNGVGSTGQARVHLIVGGTPMMNYKWYNSLNVLLRNVTTPYGDDTLKNVPVGEYTVVVFNNVGTTQLSCEEIGVVDVLEPDPILASAVVTNVKCKNAKDGTISVNPSGGTPGYSYLWNTINTNATRTNLAPGTYTVTVTDSHGCIAASASYTIVQSATQLAANVLKTNVKCGGKCTGTATASPVGGTPPYKYLWSNLSTNVSISSLCAGSYTLTVTDAYNCVRVLNFTITQNPVLVLVVAPSGLNQATASVSGGVPGYQYLWNTIPAQTTSTAFGLSPGQTYKVHVTDSKGCTKNGTVNMPLPRITSPASEINSLGISIYPNPSSGKITVSFDNQNDSYSFSLKLFDITSREVFTKIANKESGVTSFEYDFSGLSKGIYTLQIETEKGLQLIKIVLH